MGKSVFMTGVAIANSMVGSSMIIFPLNFNQYGILINIFFVFLMGALMSLTCKLLVDHLLPHQLEISQSIRRKLGPKFSFSFGLLSSILLFLVSSVFFLLAVDIFYDFFVELFGPIDFPEKIFKLILMLVFASLNFLKDLKYVFKFSPFAMAALILSTLTLIISIPFNFDNINVSFFDFQALRFSDVLTVAAINGFAFICHPSISPMVKENSDQKNNSKAVYIGFGITLVLYLLVGVLGALSIFGIHPDKHSNIIDYFSGSFQSPVVGLLNFIYLFSISPIFPYVSKNQFLELIPKKRKAKITNIWLKSSIAYAILWIPMNTLFIIFDTSPIIVISFISTVMAFYITYFLPIAMTLKRGQYITKQGDEDQNVQQSLIIPDGIDVETAEDSAPKMEGQSILSESSPTIIEQVQIPIWKKILYIGIVTFGAVMLVSQLISIFA